jgi:type II secretory pathway pseudopilin PulG
MKRVKLDLEMIVSVLIIIVVGSIVIGSTKTALLKAREKNTRENLYTLETIIKQQLDEGADLMAYLEICTKGVFCNTDKYFADNILVTQGKNPVPLLPVGLKDSTGEYLKVKPTSESTYLIWGRSSKNNNFCWIASSSKEEANLDKEQPSPCPI